MAQGVYMTQKELNRAEILSKVKDKRLKQRQAAEKLKLSLRQLQRLYKDYLMHGAKALASKKRGKASNNRIPDSLHAKVIEIVALSKYEGFRPTFMCEKLEERHSIKISRETTRKIMIECGVWRPRKERRPAVHQLRQRRSRAGELLQIDGSPHAWFENRGESCSLLVLIDDATGQTYGKFCEAETTAGYMQTMTEYINQYGAPLAVYSDKHGIFRVNHGQGTKRENFTQFGRALHELDIDLIYANSPQAKGRVERANQTLQDRLIKEMRLADIRTIDEGNRFLKMFWPKYNKKFAVVPACSENAHRELAAGVELQAVFCQKAERKVSKNLEFQFENKIYQVVQETPSKVLAGTKIDVLKHLDGTVTFTYKGSPIQAVRYDEQVAGIEVSNKEIDHFLRQRKPHKLPNDNLWLQQSRAQMRMRKYMRT